MKNFGNPLMQAFPYLKVSSVTCPYSVTQGKTDDRMTCISYENSPSGIFGGVVRSLEQEGNEDLRPDAILLELAFSALFIV